MVLTGIETGSWGRDLPDSPRLCDLLRAVDALPGIGRVRLGSLDPSVMTPRFVEIVSALPSLAPHFHLSVQSGCSATLARMHRRYNADQAEAAIARLRAAIPHVQLTTDMIVGFPGETEEEFAASLAFARRVGFLHIHVFPYSRRAGTPAATMPEQVPEPIRRRRAPCRSKAGMPFWMPPCVRGARCPCCSKAVRGGCASGTRRNSWRCGWLPGLICAAVRQPSCRAPATAGC